MPSTSMKLDDPSATYRGYRRQALYVLFRLFDDTLGNDAAIQPEGFEDLGIFDKNGQLIEVVQVKDHTSNLTASSFKPFFYERISPLCCSDSKVFVRVATFGAIGPDLLAAKEGKAVAKSRVIETISKDRSVERKMRNGSMETVIRPGLPIAQAQRIIEHLEFEHVYESELTEAIMASLAQSVVGVSPREAFDFLMWWMLTSAESKRMIRRRDAVNKLTQIGQFLEGRRAFHSEWYRSIVPLDDSEADTTEEMRNELKSEFFRGGNVRFDHIVADVDVPRTLPLTKIHQAFFHSNVAVIHSASGQGKTTLAFRYLKEFAPASFRLQLLSAEDLKHARQMALAIREHAEALGIPTLVFVDVRPGDVHWVELVREISSVQLIRVLVTIREEDWQRSTVSMADFLFSEITLNFDELEARSIYQSLREQNLAAIHIDFEEAWLQFGSRKSLLEFVYFVTQAESLTQRIKAQVRAFQNEVRIGTADPNEESLLRLVAVASTYEARLDLPRTIQQCGINSPIETLRRFKDEYFVRESNNGRLLDGFHAIRSGVISECLTDPSVLSWSEVACKAILVMEESDLEAFLLCAFSRQHDAVPELLTALETFQPTTWAGICGITRSLMWLGLREYWNANSNVIDEAFEEAAGGWLLMLDWDVSRVLGAHGWNIFENLGPTGEIAAARSRQIRAKQTDVSMVFVHLRKWLISLRGLPSHLTGQHEWMSFSEVMFWCGRLEIELSLDSEIDSGVISTAIASLPLYLVGDFVCGIREAVPNTISAWMGTCRDEIIKRLHNEAAVVKLDESDDSIVAHFLIDLDSEASRLRRADQSNETAKASLHTLTIERVELLSQLFSGKQTYGAVGYGHRLSIFALPFDEAEKPGVLAENLYPRWAVLFNALSRGLCERQFRPNDWKEFFSKLTDLRERILRCLQDLRDAVAKSKQNPNSVSIIQRTAEWDDCCKAINRRLLFPTNAVDEWGYFTESGDSNEPATSQAQRHASASRFGGLRMAINEFMRTVSNFLKQALGALVLVPALRSSTSDAQRKQILNLGLQLDSNENSIRLSVINGCDACAAVKQLHSAFDEMESLHEWQNYELERRELQEYFETMSDWASFVFPAQAQRNQVSHDGTPFEWVLRPIRNRLKNNLQGLRRHQIIAKVLPTTVEWDGKSGLWIRANVKHPITAMSALALIWEAIWKTFGNQMENPVPYCATKLIWEEIVIVLTVNDRSFDRQAYRHFKFAAFRDDCPLEQVQWALVPELVPLNVWDQIEIDCWQATDAMNSMDMLAASYSVLLQHVQHMADFVRIPDLDEQGMGILQEYLNRESKRAEPMLQATFDAIVEVIDLSSNLGDLNDSPNLVAALQALLENKDAVSPHRNGLGQTGRATTHRFSIDEVVEWRDRLTKGLEMISLARLYWLAHLLKCSELSI